LEKGVYLGPSGFEVGFISLAHTYEILDQAIIKFNKALDKAFDNK
jgi:glutamate-1-semialdehyde 2,1-aminomutase